MRKWTKEEDELLLSNVDRYGIAGGIMRTHEVIGRSYNACHTRYKMKLKKPESVTFCVSDGQKWIKEEERSRFKTFLQKIKAWL